MLPVWGLIFGGVIHGEAYFRNFTVISNLVPRGTRLGNFMRQPVSTDFRSAYLKSSVLENVFSYTAHSFSAICR